MVVFISSAEEHGLQECTKLSQCQAVSDGSHMGGCSVFHRVGPETVKCIFPYLIILECASARSPCVAEQRYLQLTDADTGVHISVM